MSKDPTSAELLERWQRGVRSAGEQLLSRHYRTVQRYFELNANWDAEELTQRTFLACIERAPHIRDAEAFPAFLLGVARRQLAMFLRSHRPTAPEDAADPPSQTGLSTLVARSRRQLLLLRALASLPRRDQTLLVLTYWEESSSAMIAQAQGVNASTVRTQLERARARLRRRLETLGRGMGLHEAEPQALRELIASLAARG